MKQRFDMTDNRLRGVIPVIATGLDAWRIRGPTMKRNNRHGERKDDHHGLHIGGVGEIVIFHDYNHGDTDHPHLDLMVASCKVWYQSE